MDHALPDSRGRFWRRLALAMPIALALTASAVGLPFGQEGTEAAEHAANQLNAHAAHAGATAEQLAALTKVLPQQAPGLSWAGWILGLPAIAAVLCMVFGFLKLRNKLPAIVTVLALGGAFVTTFILYQNYESPVTVHLYDWIRLDWSPGSTTGNGTLAAGQSLIADIGLHIDGLTLFWMLFVTGLGTLIAIFASEYMESDVGGNYARFFGAVSIFLLAMGCLVMGGNLFLLYLGWEGVGVASYLLIGYYYGKPSAVAAAKKAFIMNRIGDLGLLVGIYLTWRNFGALDYDTIFRAIANGSTGGETAYLIPYFLMLGAFGKSAQIPLFTWLPDAMEGPTPVSALIHAATMVTAGVYLIARCFPLFLLDPNALPTVAWIGGTTAFLAATIGLMQYDMKRVFAYSTVSQLGFMFLGLGVGTSYGAAFHVFTHAFFKALLFLSSGAVMHGFAGQLDIRKISGLRHIPGFKVVAYTMLVGCLWLAAIPFSAGFFSKDEILLVALTDHTHGNALLGWLGLFTATLTAYYTFRVWFRVCAGPVSYVPGDEHHGHDDHAHAAADHHPHDDHAHAGGDDHHGHAHDGGHFHPHPPRLAVNGVLAVLAIGAIMAGIPGYMSLAGGSNWVKKMIGDSTAVAGVPDLSSASGHAGHAELLGMNAHTLLLVISFGISIVGIGGAAYFHLLNRKAADNLKQSLLASPLTGWLPRALENKWYVDELYDGLFRLPVRGLAWLLAKIDSYLLDSGVINGIGRVPAWVGRYFQPLYNGVLQGYAVVMAGGLGLILVWMMLYWIAHRGGAS
ncbi:MAG: NADH-quinone oxidoreductase subunit L [Phycisphaerae bacterium]|nr:NADH-quinone oxidoreductase subunit L [Phycisphaerae bacterium]